VDLDATAVREWPCVVVGHEHAPHAEVIARKRMALAVPAIEVAGQKQTARTRRPFAVPDAVSPVALAPVEAEKVMALAD
jgi:hypothetical protein